MKKYLKEVKSGDKVKLSFMINKILSKDNGTITAYIGDKTGDIKAIFKIDDMELNVGDIISTEGTLGEPYRPEKVQKAKLEDLNDFLPSTETPVDEILNELEKLSNEEFKSPEVIALNDYFFKNEKFLGMFRNAIGGVFHHHNYLGGLAEHTLGVMYLTKVLAYKYDARYKEIAILGAKLHDIGKIYEMRYDGPFGYTLRGDLEGHIVIGITMIEEAFKSNPELFSDEFRERIKGIIVQHHGKVEFGSPKAPNTQESYLVHYADYVDATMNKITIISKGVGKGQWTDYERRIEGRLYL